MGVSDEFKKHAEDVNARAGAQNASLRVIYLQPSSTGMTRKVFLQSEIYPQHGPHTEENLIKKFWATVPSVTGLRIIRVELYSRFNTCMHCTELMIKFKQDLCNRMALQTCSNFDILLGGHLYLPIENDVQITQKEAFRRLELEIRNLCLNNWRVAWWRKEYSVDNIDSDVALIDQIQKVH